MVKSCIVLLTTLCLVVTPFHLVVAKLSAETSGVASSYTTAPATTYPLWSVSPQFPDSSLTLIDDDSKLVAVRDADCQNDIRSHVTVYNTSNGLPVWEEALTECNSTYSDPKVAVGARDIYIARAERETSESAFVERRAGSTGKIIWRKSLSGVLGGVSLAVDRTEAMVCASYTNLIGSGGAAASTVLLKVECWTAEGTQTLMYTSTNGGVNASTISTVTASATGAVVTWCVNCSYSDKQPSVVLGFIGLSKTSVMSAPTWTCDKGHCQEASVYTAAAFSAYSDYVVFSTHGGHVCALVAATSELDWCAVCEAATAPPLIDVQANTAIYMCYDSITPMSTSNTTGGDIPWTASANPPSFNGYRTMARANDHNSNILAVRPGAVTLIDGLNGAKVWSYAVPSVHSSDFRRNKANAVAGSKSGNQFYVSTGLRYSAYHRSVAQIAAFNVQVAPPSPAHQLPNDASKVWCTNLSSSEQHISTLPPLVTESATYAVDFNGVYALDTATGDHLWNYSRPSGGYESTPEITLGPFLIGAKKSKSLLFVGTQNHFRAFDPSTGALVWNTTWDGLSSDETLSARASPDGHQVLIQASQHMLALDASSGAVVWNSTHISLLSFGGSSDAFYGLDANNCIIGYAVKTGAMNGFNCSSELCRNAQAVWVHGDVLYLQQDNVMDGGNVTALRLPDLTYLWHNEVMLYPEFGADPNYIVDVRGYGNSGNKYAVRVYDAATGLELRMFDRIYSGRTPVVLNGFVYLAGPVRCKDLVSGQDLWTAQDTALENLNWYSFVPHRSGALYGSYSTYSSPGAAFCRFQQIVKK